MKRTHPGRPPLDDDDPSVRVGVSMPSKQFDELDERAKRERVRGVPALIRRILRHEKKSTK